MNIKSLCLLGLAGAICVSTGIASGLTDYNNNFPNVNSGYFVPYNISAIQNVPNQIGQNVQQRTGNISVNLENRIACIRKTIFNLRKDKVGIITNGDSKEEMLEMVLETVLGVLKQQPEQLLAQSNLWQDSDSEKIALELMIAYKAKFENYQVHNNTVNNPDVNAEVQNEDIADDWFEQYQQDAALLLNESDKICWFVQWARYHGISKQAVQGLIFYNLSSVAFEDVTPVYKVFSFFIDRLLEFY